jgi:uncharacterized protein YyaL (SSP411 family)
MQKPSFGVVSGVIAILVVVAFLAKLAVGLIPAGPENRLATEPSEFLQQASHEQVDWHTLSEETFSEARKKDKPIMLVIGSPCSPIGRNADTDVFTSKEIRGYLSRYFICVRVDSMAMPEYANAFLPLSRAISSSRGRLAIPPDFQVWFLDPHGYMFWYAAGSIQGQALDARIFLADLTEAVDRFGQIQDGKAKAGNEQRSDLEVLNGSMPLQVPDLSQFRAYLSSASPSDVGGFPTNGFQRLWPCDWRFQLLAGSYQDYLHSIAHALASPQQDLLDGGFFTDISSMDWTSVGYDKLATVNASMMFTLSLGSVILQDPPQRWIALRTFDALLTQFPQDGLVAGGIMGERDISGRSPRYSFSPRLLRELFPSDSEREWLRANLGLKVETNPQMTPMLGRLDLPLTDGDRFTRDIETLKASRPSPKFAGLAQLDVGGYVTARMMQSARILGDKDRLIKSEGLFERLDEFRSLNDVVHSHAPGVRPHAYLGDYLAYADGALQYFLATGDPEVFKNGLEVLRRGLFLFGGKTNGVFTLMQRTTSPLSPQDADAPEIVDNIRESCTAQVIRLCNDYGRLLGTSGQDLTRIAGDTVMRFSAISGTLGHFAGGYFCAAADLEDPAFAIVAGPSALADAQQLSKLAPSRLVAPALASVKAPGSKPGAYVIRGRSVQGPFTVAKAAELLRRSPL